MIFTLAKLSSAIETFNERPHDETDFHAIAARDSITVAFDHMPLLKGFCARAGGRDYIFLDNQLRGLELLFTAFHELTHSLIHVPRTKSAAAMFFQHSRPSQNDAEADAGALIFLYPKTDLAALRERLWTASAFESRLIRQRLAIFQRFGE